MCRKSSFRLRALPARRDVAKEFVASAGWQPAEAFLCRKSSFRLRALPARRDVAKEFVSPAGWQPAEALCAGKALVVWGLAARTAWCGKRVRFVCGLAACRGLMCRKISFRLWLAARKRDVAKEFVSSAGWQPAEALFLCRKSSSRLQAGSLHGIMWRKSSFRLRAGSLQRPYVPEKLFSCAAWQPARRDVAKEFVSSAG